MNKHNSVPNIRFNGFEDKWKKSELKEIAKIVGGGTPDTNNSNYWNGNINWYSPNEIGKYPYVYSSHKKITNLGLKKSSAKLHPSEKTILFTSRAGIGDMAILKTEAATNQGFQSLELKNNINPYFVYSYGFKIKREAYKLASGSTFLEISKKDMEKINLWFPTKNEQQKIGDFFTKLDKLLDLQQQKIDKLELLKKALLQKLFPKYGAKIPELRFKEFKNEWEKEKLKGYIEKVSGNDGRINLPTLTISAAKGWMNQNERFSNNIAGKEQKNYTLLKKGELSYNHGNSKLFKYGVVYELINYDEALVPKVYHSFRVNSKASARFIEYLFRGKKVDRELRKLVTSGARMDGLLNINFNNFENIQLYFPEKAEQQKIGNLLSKVDQLIELENKKLQDFQQVKKCLLQNMFVE